MTKKQERAIRDELYRAEHDLEMLKSGAVPIGLGWGANALKEAEDRVEKAMIALENAWREDR